MNKPFEILRPFPIPEAMDVEVMQSARFIEDYNEFYSSISKAPSTPFPIDTALVDSFYYYSDVPSYIRTADYLETVFREGKGIEYVFEKKEEIQFKRKHRKIRLFSAAVTLLDKKDWRISTTMPIKAIKQRLQEFEDLHFGLERYITAIEQKLLAVCTGLNDKFNNRDTLGAN